MWDRKTIKSNAKQVLRHSYWVSFAVCFVAGILAGGSGGGAGGGTGGSAGFSAFNGLGRSDILIVLSIILFVFAIVLAVMIFFSIPVLVGEKCFFIRAPYGDVKFSHLFSSFKGGRYMPIVKAMFMTNLVICLWTLLFIVPGIIKIYQYRFVAYLISDDPSLTPHQAMDLSRQMTDGEKFSMFVLDLSFIGWGLLGIITFGIGLMFLKPYFEATWAQLYFALRTKVITPGYGNAPNPNF